MRTTRAASQGGYVLIVALLLGSLIVATTVAYARHTIVTWRQSTASLWVHETREAAQSGLAFARQVLAAGQSLGTSSLGAGKQTISVVVTNTGGDQRAIRVEATSEGLGATLEADARVFGLTGAALPTVSAAAASAVNTDPGLIQYTGTTTVQNTVLTGTLLLQRGAQLTLRDVVLKGSIVSQAALNGPPYNPATATSLTLGQGVRIEPTGVLPGCAILLPDGAVTADATCSFEIHGAVIAKSFTVSGSGAIDGYVVTSTAAPLPASVDRPGFGRTPPEWPAALQLGAFGLKTMAFHAPATDGSEILAIKDFPFPAK